MFPTGLNSSVCPCTQSTILFGLHTASINSFASEKRFPLHGVPVEKAIKSIHRKAMSDVVTLA